MSVGGHPLRVLFFLRAVHYDRVFEPLLRALVERGHQVHVAVETARIKSASETRLFDRLRAERPGFSHERLSRRADRWLPLATALRLSIDYLRYLEPEFAPAVPLRERARSQAPRIVRALVTLPPCRWRGARRLLARTLRGLERALPVPRDLMTYIESRRPNVVLVAPLVSLGSPQGDVVRAAAALGIPTVLPVASWDNLTNKGLIRDLPTLTVVWNEAQVQEAVLLHRLPAERVVAVGAHAFDHWFGWRPSRSRQALAAELGLDGERPLLLYVCSSSFIAPDEPGFVREWLARLRADERLRDAAVIIRPHPKTAAPWRDCDLDEPGRVVVWPRRGAEPRDDVTKADYYDSLYHSRAVFGINTSALIEAAIVGRPTLTLVSDRFATQDGTLHFSHIAGEDGLLVVARTWQEHLDQLAAALAPGGCHEERLAAFVRRFVRPLGLERAAAPLAVDAIERAAAMPVTPASRRASLATLITTVLARLLERSKARTVKHEAIGATARTNKSKKKEKPRRSERPTRRRRGNAMLPRLRQRASKFLRQERKRGRHAARGARRTWTLARRRLRGLWNMRWRFTYRRTLQRVPSRDEIPALLNARRLLGEGAEIGVRTGRFSEFLLSRWRGHKLLSIDPWLAADPSEYVDGANVSQPEFDANYSETRERLARHGQRSEVWRLMSLEAAARVADRSLDFVYIDARHDYASVKEDLAAWFPKVRPGGILAGHDYIDGYLRRTDFGVKSAVDEFFAARGLPVHVTQGPTAVETFPSWIVEISG